MMAVDEYISETWFHAGVKGVKLSGLDAAAAGGLSGLTAQLLTTPVRSITINLTV